MSTCAGENFEGLGLGSPSCLCHVAPGAPAFYQGSNKAQSKGEMVMKKGFLASAAIAMAMLISVPAGAAEYVTILLDKVVNRTPDQTWAKIGPYCSIATWLKVTCVITAGNGNSVGSNRLLNGNNNEVMVAATPYSYTYTQPATTILYHGTLAVEPLDRGRQSKIVYTLFYDQAPLATDQAKAENRAMRTKRFSEALDAMKAMAESP
jgi:hypothetical protein